MELADVPPKLGEAAQAAAAPVVLLSQALADNQVHPAVRQAEMSEVRRGTLGAQNRPAAKEVA